jgi:hypothetical protein
MPIWEQDVFLEFRWAEIHAIVIANKIMRLETRDPLFARLGVFHGRSGRSLQLDPGAAQDGAVPLLMTLGTLSRNHYIAFDSTLAMLRSVCAAQDAGILRYRTTREGTKEVGEIEYDPRELWDVIRPFNPRADYWEHLIAGTVDFNEIEFELPKDGRIQMDPEVRRLVFGTPEDYAPRPKKPKKAGARAASAPSPSASRTTILFDGEVFADSYQFYLADPDAMADPPMQDFDAALSDRMLCCDGMLLVTTAREMTVPLRVELHDGEPAVDLDAADHVARGGLRTEGEIVIAGGTEAPDAAARARVPAGDLRAMVVFTGLGSVSEDGVDGEDRYVVHLWPGAGTEVSVLKRWSAEP